MASWENARDKWLQGRIQPEERIEDVLGWIQNDPMWEKADKIDFGTDGSHFVTIYVKDLGQLYTEWSGDAFQISSKSGRKVKKWQIRALVKGYEELCTV